jgi:hypothetical protein
MTKKLKNPLVKSVTDATVEALSDINKLFVCSDGPDTAAAVREGAVLLAISSVDNDRNGDGFRYLIGLKRGTKITPYLGNFFS